MTTDNDQHDTHADQGIPEDLRRIHTALDELGDRDRAAPDAAFEERLLTRARAARAGTTDAHDTGSPFQIPRPAVWGRLALAASIVLVAAIAITLRPGAGTQAPPPLAAQEPDEIRVALESNLDALESLDALATGLDTQLAEVSLRADAVDAQIMMPALLDDPLDPIMEDAL